MEDKKDRLQGGPLIRTTSKPLLRHTKSKHPVVKAVSFCCSDAGSIHITTLEGLVIRDRIHRLPGPGWWP